MITHEQRGLAQKEARVAQTPTIQDYGLQAGGAFIDAAES